jgi:DNA-binding MarR family transcriptional regulator
VALTERAPRRRRKAPAPAAPRPLVDPIDQATEQWREQRPDLDPSPMEIFGRITRVHALQRAAQAAVHAPLGLTYSAFDLLANLRRSGAPYRKTASSLSDSSMITTGGNTFRMDGLESAQLIRRVRGDEDRRVVQAELTAAGLELIDRAMEAHLAMEHALLTAFDPGERETLAALLRKLESALLDHNEQAAEPGEG